jgi:hypothetical protein
MKKLLTLVLCWLIAFSAMAETTLKAKTALSAAGGYITSQNKVDGSFEDGIASWSASVGTIVKTASTEIQGNNLGVWSGTGAGTLDLQWTATASNTFDANAFVNVGGEDDVYVCAYVGTTETGCKLIPALDKIQKVSVIADSIISSAFYLRLKHTGSDAFSVKVDDGKIEPWNLQNVQTVDRENIKFLTYSSQSSSLNKYTTTATETTYGSIISYDNFGAYTRINIVSNGQGTVTSSNDLSGAGTCAVARYSSSGVLIDQTLMNSSSVCTATWSGSFSIGDYFVSYSNPAPVAGVSTNFSAQVFKSRDNVIQSYQDGTEWTSYTPTILGFVTPTSIEFQWKRIGSDVLIRGRFSPSGTSGVEARISLPSGLTSASSTVIPSLQIAGQAETTSSGSVYFGMSTLMEPSVTYFTLGYQSSTTGAFTKALGSGTTSSPIAVTARIPIAGWSSSPTLLALPTSKRNEFSAQIAANGSITTLDGDWINSVTVSGTSIFTIDITKLGLTVSPNVETTVIHNTTLGSQSLRNAWVSSVTPTSIVVKTTGLTSTAIASADVYPFMIKITKQSPDYTPQGVFVGNVAKNQVAIVQYRGNGTRTAITSGGVAMPLTVAKGDSSIVNLKSGTNGQSAFELQAGVYDIECSPWVYLGNNFGGGMINNYLYNVSDSIEVDRGQPVENATGASVLTSFHPKMVAVVSITSAKIFEYKLIGGSGIASAFIGDSITSPNDLGGYCKITKLNGN